eukprot:INCI13340.1.p1 GENE.INCI13340.1~~INCI13340.1.p1  ORF type:complete len:399 (-),score=43.71 INCI13340.1:851-2047(-)
MSSNRGQQRLMRGILATAVLAWWSGEHSASACTPIGYSYWSPMAAGDLAELAPIVVVGVKVENTGGGGGGGGSTPIPWYYNQHGYSGFYGFYSGSRTHTIRIICVVKNAVNAPIEVGTEIRVDGFGSSGLCLAQPPTSASLVYLNFNQGGYQARYDDIHSAVGYFSLSNYVDVSVSIGCQSNDECYECGLEFYGSDFTDEMGSLTTESDTSPTTTPFTLTTTGPFTWTSTTMPSDTSSTTSESSPVSSATARAGNRTTPMTVTMPTPVSTTVTTHVSRPSSSVSSTTTPSHSTSTPVGSTTTSHLRNDQTRPLTTGIIVDDENEHGMSTIRTITTVRSEEDLSNTDGAAVSTTLVPSVNATTVKEVAATIVFTISEAPAFEISASLVLAALSVVFASL